MTAQEACDLQNALDRTNREFDEADIIPEETAKDRFIDNVCRRDTSEMETILSDRTHVARKTYNCDAIALWNYAGYNLLDCKNSISA